MVRKMSGTVFIRTCAILAGLLLLAPQVDRAQAQLRIDVNEGSVDPMPIVVSDLFGANGQKASEFGARISDVIRNNLQRSGLFRVIDRSRHVQAPADMRVVPNFAAWRSLSPDALVTGKTEVVENGLLRTEFRLWDVLHGEQIVGQVYSTDPETYRRIGHVISDAIYKSLTGEDGYFDTRIVYVSESGPGDGRVKRLAIMDQDGANHRYLTNGRNLVLTPRFSPTQQVITYMSYFRRQPRVYLYNIETGQHEILGDFPGMTFAPRFSPDGEQVIFSMARDGNSDLFSMDLRTRLTRRLTRHRAIDTSPSFSPNRQQVVFNSDRSSKQQIYVMDASGSNVRRISFGRGRYATPVWSPRGDLIAFTKMLNRRFFIGVMRPDGSGERILTESFLDEGPTWSPNGRVLMFFRQTLKKDGSSTTRLWSVDLTGHNLRPVKTPIEASDPAWSPLSPLNR